MTLRAREFCHLMLPAWLLLAACGGRQENPTELAAGTKQAPVDEAARAQQAREDEQAAELQQAEQAIESNPPDTLSQDQFYQIIDYYCGGCHFPTDYPTENQLAYFNDLGLLIERDRVIPGDAEGSPLIAHMRADQTPPAGWNTPPVSDIAIALVADFIDRLPAQSAGGG